MCLGSAVRRKKQTVGATRALATPTFSLCLKTIRLSVHQRSFAKSSAEPVKEQATIEELIRDALPGSVLAIHMVVKHHAQPAIASRSPEKSPGATRLLPRTPRPTHRAAKCRA